jgi:hypothetical protein
MSTHDNLRILPRVAFLVWLLLSSPAIAGDYVIHQDGTLTDNLIGLTWQRKDDNVKRDWPAARDYCQNLSFAGHDDWRLPNNYELRTIRVEGSKNPAIDQDAFPATKAEIYWSGSELPYYEERAFFVDFGEATLANTANENLEAMKWQNQYFSRCVRGTRKKVNSK